MLMLSARLRFVSIDRPSDLLVEVDEISFHLHKVQEAAILCRLGLRDGTFLCFSD